MGHLAMKRAVDARNVVVVVVDTVQPIVVVAAAADDSCRFAAFAVFADHNPPD